MKMSPLVCIGLVLVITVLQTNNVAGHVALTFPPARNYDLDFLDNSRTKGPCGMPKGKFIHLFPLNIRFWSEIYSVFNSHEWTLSVSNRMHFKWCTKWRVISLNFALFYDLNDLMRFYMHLFLFIFCLKNLNTFEYLVEKFNEWFMRAQ